MEKIFKAEYSLVGYRAAAEVAEKIKNVKTIERPHRYEYGHRPYQQSV